MRQHYLSDSLLTFAEADPEDGEPEPQWPDTRWECHRDYRSTGYHADDDYIPCDSWHAKWAFLKRDYYATLGGNFDVEVKLALQGKRYKGKLHATAWYATVEFGRRSIFIGIGKCKSLRDAFRKVERLEDVIARAATALQHAAYTKPFEAQCVSRENAPGVWEPFCTLLCAQGYSEAFDVLPPGKYKIMIRYQDLSKTFPIQIRMEGMTNYGNYCESSSWNGKDPRESAETWFPPESTSRYGFGDGVRFTKDVERRHGFVMGPAEETIVGGYIDVCWVSTGICQTVREDDLQISQGY